MYIYVTDEDVSVHCDANEQYDNVPEELECILASDVTIANCVN